MISSKDTIEALKDIKSMLIYESSSTKTTNAILAVIVGILQSLLEHAENESARRANAELSGGESASRPFK